jgi:hypothetical protein
MEFAFPKRENRLTNSELITPVGAVNAKQEFFYAQFRLRQGRKYDQEP